MNSKYTRTNAGFTLLELLVSLGIFSFISLATVTYAASAFKRINLENRAAVVSQELRNGIDLIVSELQMSRSISPYLPGDDASLTNCTAALAVTPNTLHFMVTHDDGNATGGIRVYYVAYSYDSASGELRRGEVQANSYSECEIPAIDPLENSIVIANNLVEVDNNEDGALDDIFILNSPTLQINLGFEISGASNHQIRENFSTDVVLRAES
jgi:prepilin-type N-terminal cleavage/methylation domain-containing protein